MAPLEKRVLDNDPVIDRNQIYFIFYNLREIHAEHQTILRLVKNRVYNPEEFTKKSVADIFTNNVCLSILFYLSPNHLLFTPFLFYFFFGFYLGSETALAFILSLCK